MLIRLTGALLILCACGGAGLGHSRELRDRVRRLEGLLRGVELLRFEICRLQTPLPQALRRLAAEESALFASLESVGEEMQERPFRELWTERVAALGLRSPEAEALRALGGVLSTGDAERGLAVCEEELQRIRQRAGEEADAKCRLSAVLGLCAGALTVVVLL